MNKHYYYLLLVGYLALFAPNESKACGYDWVSDCSSQAHLRINGSLDSFNIAACPSGYNFDGLQLGNIQSLALANAKTITWESCQNNVSGVQLRYRVYEQGFPGGNWLTLNLAQYKQVIDGPYTTRYRSAPVNISLTSGLQIGKNYTLEIYLVADVDTIGDDNIPETTLLRNNNGANYKLNFTWGGASAPPLALLPHLTEPSCNGSSDGKISVSAYGDLNGVFYQWSNINLNFFQQNNLAAGNYAITVSNGLGQSAVANMQLGQPAILQTTFSNVQSVGCNNNPGLATVSPSGGTAPYQFHWENGQQTQTATLISGGLWHVTVTDAHQCTNTNAVSIGNTGQVQKNLSVDICMGEAFTLNNQIYTVAGVYTLNVPGTTGCDTLVQLTLQVLNPGASLVDIPNNLTLSCSQPSQVLCALQSSNTSFQWWKDGQPSASTACLSIEGAGIFAVQATTSGLNKTCTATKIIQTSAHFETPAATISGNFMVTCLNPAPSGWLIAQTDAQNASFSWVLNGVTISTDDSCFVTLSEWQGGAPVLPELTVTDGYGCQSLLPLIQVNITIEQNLPITSISTVDASSATATDGSASVEVTQGPGPYIYLWNNGATTPDISGLSAGEYCVTVTSSNGCTSVNCATVGFFVATTDRVSGSLKIAPNPAAQGATISLLIPQEMQAESQHFEVTNESGSVLYAETMFQAGQPIINFQLPAHWGPGIFVLHLRNRKKSLSGKIIVR